MYGSGLLAVAVEGIDAECLGSLKGDGHIVAFPFDIVECAGHALACAVAALGIYRVRRGIYGAVNVLLGEVELLHILRHMIYRVLNYVEIVKTAIASSRATYRQRFCFSYGEWF